MDIHTLVVYIHMDSYEEVKIKTHLFFFSKEFNFLRFFFFFLAFGWVQFLLLIGYCADQAGLEEHGKGIRSFLWIWSVHTGHSFSVASLVLFLRDRAVIISLLGTEVQTDQRCGRKWATSETWALLGYWAVLSPFLSLSYQNSPASWFLKTKLFFA